MMPEVIGLEEKEAIAELESCGLSVTRTLYTSKRGVPDADSHRVIRQRMIGNNMVEITVSGFKTLAG